MHDRYRMYPDYQYSIPVSTRSSTGGAQIDWLFRVGPLGILVGMATIAAVSAVAWMVEQAKHRRLESIVNAPPDPDTVETRQP